MSSPSPSRGQAPNRGRGRGSRGGRTNRGKSMRARGSSRGHRIPPEYLRQVIAQRQGLDPSEIANMTQEDWDELEAEEMERRAEEEKKYAKREIVQTHNEEEAVGVELKAPDEQEVDEEEIEREKHTAAILAKSRARIDETPLPTTSKPSTSVVDDSNDVDQELAARMKGLRTKSGPGAGSSEKTNKVVVVEWDAAMEVLSKEKAEAEARDALKNRFRTQVSKPSLAQAKKPSSQLHSLKSDNRGKPIEKPAEEQKLDQLEDFLDELLK